MLCHSKLYLSIYLLASCAKRHNSSSQEELLNPQESDSGEILQAEDPQELELGTTSADSGTIVHICFSAKSTSPNIKRIFYTRGNFTLSSTPRGANGMGSAIGSVKDEYGDRCIPLLAADSDMWYVHVTTMANVIIEKGFLLSQLKSDLILDFGSPENRLFGKKIADAIIKAGDRMQSRVIVPKDLDSTVNYGKGISVTIRIRKILLATRYKDSDKDGLVVASPKLVSVSDPMYNKAASDLNWVQKVVLDADDATPVRDLSIKVTKEKLKKANPSFDFGDDPYLDHYITDSERAEVYVISNPAQWLSFARDSKDWCYKHVILATDLDFSLLEGSKNGVYTTRDPDDLVGSEDCSFSGILNGNGRTISNFNIDISDSNKKRIALFRDVMRATILNLTYKGNVLAHKSLYVAGIAASVRESTLKNVHYEGSISGSFSLGGIASIIRGATISDCSVVISTLIFTGNVLRLGGIFGSVGSRIDNNQISGCSYRIDSEKLNTY